MVGGAYYHAEGEPENNQDKIFLKYFSLGVFFNLFYKITSNL